jgi:hypothetical protein
VESLLDLYLGGICPLIRRLCPSAIVSATRVVGAAEGIYGFSRDAIS